MANDYYKIGSHNGICDNCGKKYKSDQLRPTHDDFIMCLPRKCWYPKHPNEYPRQVPIDGLPVVNARPRAPQTANKYIHIHGTTRWEDTGLHWNSKNWRWDDDLSNAPLFHDGNP